jgi:hypothetical protein
MSTGAWRVTCPDGSRVQIHLTPSDRNHVAHILGELNDRGFEAAEAEAEKREKIDREKKLAADRDRNARRTEASVVRATALARAAGPYGPAQVTLAELVGDHPAPLVYHRVAITPDMARGLLERNSRNRPIRSADVTQWCTILRTGRWRYTHQGVALDTLGRLQDGQHRLTAIEETGVPAEMMVSVGMPPENFAVIDSGRRRSAAQVLAMDGAKYAATLAAMVRLLYLYQVWGGSMLEHANERLGNDVIAEIYGKLELDDVAFALSCATRLRLEIGGGHAGPSAAFYLIARAMPPGDGAVVRFTEDLIVGADDTNDPAYAIRRALTRQATGVARKLTAAQSMALVIKGWNARIEGKRSSHFAVRSGSTMPAVLTQQPE